MDSDGHTQRIDYLISCSNRKVAMLPTCFWIMIMVVLVMVFAVAIEARVEGEMMTRVRSRAALGFLGVVLPLYLFLYVTTLQNCLNKIVEGKNITLSDIDGFLVISVMILLLFAITLLRLLLYPEGDQSGAFHNLYFVIAAMSVVIMFGIRIVRYRKNK